MCEEVTRQRTNEIDGASSATDGLVMYPILQIPSSYPSRAGGGEGAEEQKTYPYIFLPLFDQFYWAVPSLSLPQKRRSCNILS